MNRLSILHRAAAATIAALLAAMHRFLAALLPATVGAGAKMHVSGRSSWLMPLVMLCCLASSLLADQFGDFTYTDNGTTITIDSYPATATGAVDVPVSIVGKPVTGIADFAFYGCGNLTGITLPAGVVTIGEFAFYACSGLTRVTLPASVTSIGDFAFYNCSRLTRADFTGNAPTMGAKVFQSAASGFTIYYYEGAAGFTSPIWIEYPALAIPDPATLKDILTFDFGTLGAATITGTNISLTVPYGTNVAALAPTFTLSPGAACDHVSGTAYDFTNPVTYTVLAVNLTTKAYAVTVAQTTPLIVVEQPAGTLLANGSATVNYGSSLTGVAKPLTFTLKNAGTAPLSGIAVTKDGTNTADYALTTAPPTSLAPGGTSTFVVTFTPAAAGTRVAAMHIASNDNPTRNPFNVALSGTGMLPPSSAKDILTFEFPGLPATTIAGTNISATVPHGTDVTALAPTYTVSPLATGSPASGTVRNFTMPQNYTITAEDGSTKVYTVTVTLGLAPTLFTWAGAAAGNWSDATKWTNDQADGTAPGAAGQADYSLIFNAAGTYTATHDLNAGFLLNGISFGGSNVTLAGNSLAFAANGATLPTISQNSSIGVTISTPLALAADLTVGGTGSGTLALSGVVSGTGRLVKASPGTLTLSGANTYSGGTTVAAGTLVVSGAGTLGAATGDLTVNGNSARVVVSLPPTPRTVAAFTLLNGGQLIGPGSLSATAFNVESGTISAKLAGTGATLTKNNTGTVTLSGINTYTGDTNISAGTLVLGAAGTITASSGLNLAPGAVLDTSAKTSFAIPAAQPVTVHLDGTGVGSSGRIHAAGLDLTNATVAFAIDTPPDDAVYVLADYSSLTGTPAVLGVPAGYTIDSAYNGGTQIALVAAGESNYTIWASGFPGFIDTDPTHDPDGDGMTNNLEFAFGLNPTLDSSANPITVPFDETTYKFSYTRHAGSGLTYAVATSQDLANWTADVGTTQVVSGLVGGVEMVDVTLSPASVKGVRLVITGPPDLFSQPYFLEVFAERTVEPSTSTVVASPVSVPADGATTSTITVTLKDLTATPVPDKIVSLTSSRGATDTISVASGPSSASGVVTFTVKSATPGTSVFTATDTTDNVVLTLTATVTFTPTAGGLVMDYVPVGNPGNAADPTTGYGAVGYDYQIAKNETTISQYCEFLNAVAKTDTYGLYDPNMAGDICTAGIDRAGSSGNYTYSVVSGSGNKPIAYVSWLDAARFCNWLHNGQPSGAQNAATTEDGAYTLNGAISEIILKNPAAKVWIPSEDEWYKAAYHDPNKGGVGIGGYWLYPTQSDTLAGNTIGIANSANHYDGDYVGSGNSTFPTSISLTDVGAYGSNSDSFYGTNDQGGNLFEWNDAVISGSLRGLRGGDYGNYGSTLASSNRYMGFDPSFENGGTGFRVVSGPAPAADILTFGLPGNPAIITGTNISLTVPYGTNVTSLAPTFTLSPGATCDHVSGSAYDFTNPVHYLVTSWDSLVTKDYTVAVTIAASPPQIPTDGLVVWLAADAVELNDTSQVRSVGADTFVKQWNDQSGNLHHATNPTEGDQPMYIASGANGKPVLRFTQVSDDAGSELKLGDLSASFPTAGSMFAVATINNDGRYNLFDNRDNDSRWVANTWSESQVGTFRNARTSLGANPYSSWPQSGSHVYALESSSSIYRFVIDGTQIGSDTADYNSGSGQDWTIGDRPGNGQQLNGDIAELILFNRVLSPEEAGRVGAYLTQKYGLTTAYPETTPKADILTFGLPGYPAVINGTNIALTVPYGTNLSNLTPAFTLSPGATCDHVSGAQYDFTNPVVYTVLGSDLTTKSYTVTVTTRNLITPPSLATLLFSTNTDSLPADGAATGPWAQYLPAGGPSFAAMGSPTVEVIDGVKWEKNLYADGDGYRVGGPYSTAIPCAGASIVVAVKPTRNGIGGNWSSVVDLFYDRLILGIKNDSGLVVVRRNGTFTQAAGQPIPDGQTTILSMVVQPDGSYKVFADGTEIAMTDNGPIAGGFTSIAPGVVGAFGSYINIGRNNPDGWTVFNGHIGDVFVYTSALSDTDRRTLEAGLAAKFIASAPPLHTISASAGANGTISPSGAVAVNQGSNQTFTITADPGYVIADVIVDGISYGAVSNYTFTNVLAGHSIAATFVTSAAPEIAVEQPAGITDILDGGSKNFGTVAVGSNASLAFTIKNTGSADLTGLAITKDGANEADFTVTSSPVAPVSGPSGTTTFTVRFAPAAAGSRTAAIHIASNDSNENPFDINLTGAGVAPSGLAIDYVPVGNPGNVADTTGYGAVGYDYQIAKNETTISQYCEFLNAVAKSDPYGLYSTYMSSAGGYSYIAGINRSGSSGSYIYSVVPGSGNKPITFVSWFDAARFCNWMHNGQGSGSTETGAYPLNGATSGIILKNAGATVWIPSENEWYKAAYYAATKGGNGGYWVYPMQSDALAGNTIGAANSANYDDGDYVGYPGMALTDVGAYGANSDSFYGTNDQGGNVWEWNDVVIGSSRGRRGGSWATGVGIFGDNSLHIGARSNGDPTYEDSSSGFRVAAVHGSMNLILTFGLPGNPAVINGTSVFLTVPYGTNVAALAPTFTLSPGATCDHISDTAYDFTSPVTYTVLASDLTTKAYIVTVTVASPDTTPPTPDPMTWASVPAPASDSSITMTATTASDASGVQYYFDCTSADGHDSAWQDSPIYTDTGLTASTSYTYQVQARDKSSGQNATAFSAPASAIIIAADTTPPTLTSIADDQGGGPVAVNSVATYTVTFSEDMDASTVDAADFGNAGTSAITIGTITEASPGVFAVPVTPTGAGTLQLAVNAGAVLTDVAGNALDTTSAILDNTALTVNQPAAIATHPASTTINSGSTTTLTVTASGTAPFTYQWYQGASGTTTTPVGTNSASFTTPALTATTNYWVKVTNAANPTGANSNTATVAVNYPIPVENFSFELPYLRGDTTTSGPWSVEAPPGWTAVAQIPGPSDTAVGVTDSTNSMYSNSNGPVLPGTADGAQLGYMNLDYGNQYFSNTFTYSGFSLGTFVQGATYKLTIALGGRRQGNLPSTFRIDLLANGARVGSGTSATAVMDTFFDVNYTFTATAAEAGKPIGIQIFAAKAASNIFGQANFDNVRLTTSDPGSNAEIRAFGLPGYPAVINGSNISLAVPYGTNVTSLAPTFILAAGARCDTPSGTVQDFTAPQAYTVTSGDGLVTTVYTVTAVVGPTWINDASGLWSTASNWSGGIVANDSGGTADFNSANLTADRTVSLDSPRTIGNLIFGDTAAASAAGWTVNNNGSAANILTLAGESPTITVNALGTGKDATISAELAGTAGLTKTGPGTLTLTHANFYTGNTVIDDGVLRLGGTNGSVGVGNVINNGTLAFNHPGTSILSNIVFGTGSLRQDGPGTVLLAGDKFFTGATVLTGGTLAIASDLQLGTAPSLPTTGKIVLSGGARLAVSDSGTTLDANRGMTLNGSGGILAATGANNLIYRGNVTGTGGLTLSMPGTGEGQFGNVGSDYSGGTTIAAGSKFVIFNSSTGSATTGNLTGGDFGRGTIVMNAASIRPTTAGTRTVGNAITLQGNLTMHAPPSGTSTSMIFNGPVTITGATRSIANKANTAAALLTLSGSIGDGGNQLGLAFDSTAGRIVILSGSNTYTGRTTVASGVLRVGSSGLSNGTDVTLAGGTLDLAGASPTAKSLTVTGADAVIDFGSASSTNSLRFTNGATAGWTGNVIIRNFNPATDTLFFGSAAAGIADNISRIRLDNPVGYPAGSYSLVAGANGSLALAESVSGDYRYTTFGNSAILSGYAGAGGNLVIPAKLSGLPVTAIGAAVFANNPSLTSVTIPATVTSIGNSAFFGCTKLASALFKGDAPSMGTQVFDGAAAGFTVYFYNGKTGFTSPTWLGYPALNLGDPAAEKDILTFDFGSLGQATIGGTDIDLTVPSGTNVTSLAPTFTLSPGATCDHASGSGYDFTNPVIYTVLASDLTTKAYTVTVTVTPPLAATVTLADLAHSYDGTPKAATATTDPTGLAVALTYDGAATAPTNAGSYAVLGTIADPAYTGTASGTLVIAKAAATVTLGGLTQTYNGLPRAATATTSPEGLTATLSYDGSPAAPTNVGTYAVIATIDDANFAGTASGTLTITPSANGSGIYRITDIGAVTSVQGLDDAGRVVGESVAGQESYGNYGHPFLWQADTGMRDLGLLSGKNQGRATGISNSGAISGLCGDSRAGWFRSFIWTPSGGLADLGNPPAGYPYFAAYGINDQGNTTIMNWSYSGPPTKTYLYSGTSYTWLGSLGNDSTYTQATAINNANQIVGYSGIPSGAYHAFIWDGISGMLDLGTLPGGTYSYALGVNESGQVAGRGDVANGERAFLWQAATGMRGLGVLSPDFNSSGANGLNNSGQVVGYSTVAANVTHAVFWGTDSSVVDLSTRVANLDGWTNLDNAVDINNNGQIIGTGSRSDGTTHAFMLEPITAAPVVVTHPTPSQMIGSGSSASLAVEVIGSPDLTYQWYEGESGNTLSPVAGATVASFTTPALTSSTRYWVRASNAEGIADSATAEITVSVPPSTNANLANLVLSAGTLSPAFDPAVPTYAAKVASGISGIAVTPTLASAGASVRVNGIDVAPGTASGSISLNEGANAIIVAVMAGDGVTGKTYTISITRAAPLVLSTEAAEVMDSATVRLRGTVNPHGVATVYFEYGTSTAYGETTLGEEISGELPVAFEATLNGLPGDTTYHYRAVAVNAEDTVYGSDVSFTTTPEAPVAATGDPAAVGSSGATLVGAVDPMGLPTEVYFEYGLTELYGKTTPVQEVPAGSGIVDVLAPKGGLLPNATYHYRIVANNSAGSAVGEDVVFVVSVGSGVDNASPTAKPSVNTEGVAGVGSQGAILRGSVNPNEGTTVAHFEYGPTDSYGRSTAVQGVGNGNTFAEVSLAAEGLPPGTPCHYRVVASNSLGTTQGADAVFTTSFPPPAVSTGEALVVTSTSVRVGGSVRANNTPAAVYFDYGTDGITFPSSISATPGNVAGDAGTAVSADLANLAQGVTYYYRVRAEGSGGSGLGEVRFFEVALLSGLIQHFPDGVPLAERQGSVSVTLTPGGLGGGWRFAGEQTWRLSGVSASGLSSGARVLEYRPVAGHLQPPNETVSVVSGAGEIMLDRACTPSGLTGSGTLLVTLKPEALAADTLAVAQRAQWRLFGENDAQWKDSGTWVGGLVPGKHLIECKALDGRATPPPVTAVIGNGQTSTCTLTYYIEQEQVGTPPGALAFEVVSASEDRPYAYSGQIRSDAGSSSGFVVRPRVVATAGHVVFDDGSLSAASGLQWLFQRDRGVHEPQPQIPRGFYLMTGYDAQRALDNSPGTSSPQAQNLDAAALFLLEDAGRGGFSGYLASDLTSNEFLLSPALKTLVGYPVDGIAADNRDRMHATPAANIIFAQAFGRTYTTSDVHSAGGNSGGPLCVQFANGAFYPAAIYLGGTAQTVVRAIDGDVVELIGFAEASGEDGVERTGGNLIVGTPAPIDTPALGALQVMIEPAAVRAAGAGWRIRSQAPYQAGGFRKNDLSPNTYTVDFSTVDGYLTPSRHSVAILGGELASLSFTYEKILLPPVITSPVSVTAIRGQALSYQMSALNSPDRYSLRGGLPDGMSFDAGSGLIHGAPQEAGSFVVTVGAENAGGADTRTLVIVVLPVLAPQELTLPSGQPFVYQIVSSESGNGITHTAGELPLGLALEPSSGRISGTPEVSGSFAIPISVTIRSATAASVLTLNVTGSRPAITLQPVASRTIAHGGSTTLTVKSGGDPAPAFQWYQGVSGVTTTPMAGAIFANFTTPALSAETSYWVRASSISGSADSTTAVISLLPSVNANLANLVLSSGSLSPAFNAGIIAYTASVSNAVSSLTVTPSAEVVQSTVRINGASVALDSPSAPIALAAGPNTISVEATAGDGTTLKTYDVTVTRAAPASVVTGPATDVEDKSATLTGTVTPNGAASVFFQFGRSTAYEYATLKQDVSGSNSLQVQAILRGLAGDTIYHFRIGVTSASGTLCGEDRLFTTSPDAPLAATGDAVDVTTTKATLIGAVDTNGLVTEVYFEYGPSTAYGQATAPHVIPAGVGVVDIAAEVSGLSATYHYRLVAKNSAGTAYGEDVLLGNGRSVILSSLPDVTTGGVIDLNTTSGVLQGIVNPHNKTTLVHFEYGLTSAYGSSTKSRGVGNGNETANVTQEAEELLPGTLYHYRAVASNSHGTVVGGDATFTTRALAPLAATGEAAALTSASARVSGTVRARGADSEVFFDYGTDAANPALHLRAFPATVGGEAETPVSVDLPDLDATKTYYYQVRAVSTGGTARGEVKPLLLGALLGVTQRFSKEMSASERDGQVLVSLAPAGTGGWRFVGEPTWRVSGVAVTGLTSGDREIEYRPVAGYIQPAAELVGVVSGAAPLLLERFYYASATSGSGKLKVSLDPAALSAPGVPVATWARWRLMGDSDTAWRDSGDEISGLMTGSYLVECRAVPGWNAPPPSTVVVEAAATRTLSLSYFPASAPSLNPPAVVRFETVSSSRNLPYAYVGQVRSDTGSYSGFVVKPRVVATVGQAVFDDVTLTASAGMQWLLQRDKGAYEPEAQIPRGFYVFDGYAAQRTREDTPGTLSIESQNLNVAALYFAGDAGRGGFSGFLASDAEANEFIQAAALKSLIGYPVSGIASANQGRMHATSPVNAAFALEFGRTYTSSGIRGIGGMAGGPLCVQRDGGSYYPAGIYVGGTTRGAVRAIDSGVIDLFSRAEISGNGGDNNTGGGITHSSFASIGDLDDPGALKVTLEPAAARSAGGAWLLKPETSYRLSGAQKVGLNAGSYVLQLKPVSGFQVPAEQTILVTAGQLEDITFTYLEDVPPPLITSANVASGTRGQPLTYQIAAGGAPTSYVLTGSLPAGLVFNAATGLISGTLQQAGVFALRLGASNAGGTGTLDFTLTSRPSLANQSATVPLLQTMAFQIASSESGPGVSYSATGLPPGVTVDPVSGLISGAPLQAGVATASISVAKGGASAAATFTLTTTASALDLWRLAKFGPLFNTAAAADSGDPDGDGSPNADEYAAGTDPNNASDVFKVLTASKGAAAFSVTAAGKASRTYVLERRANLGAGPWTEVGAFGPLAADAAVTLIDPAPPATAAFYRMRVSAP